MSLQALLSPDTRGRTPLWVVFWIFGVAVSQVLFGIILHVQAQQHLRLLWLLLAVFVAYTLLIVRAVWINADNVRNPRWGEIARMLTVAWAINALLVSAFLAINRGPLFPLFA